MSLLPRRAACQRGASISVLIAMLIPVLLLCAGLAIDGAAKASADRRAEAAAAQAARAGQDAAAPVLLAGADAAGAATAAANRVLAAHPGISGQATVLDDGLLQVTTSTSVDTVFLGLVGIDELAGRGSATVELRMR